MHATAAGQVTAMLLAGHLNDFWLVQYPPAPYGGFINGQYYGGYTQAPHVSLCSSTQPCQPDVCAWQLQLLCY